MDKEQLFELRGLARALLVDGKLTKEEVTLSRRWLKTYKEEPLLPELKSFGKAVEAAFKKGPISAKDCENVTTALKNAVGKKFADSIPTQASEVFDDADELNFWRGGIAFSKKLSDDEFNKRAEQVETIHAHLDENVTLQTDVLVVLKETQKTWGQNTFDSRTNKAIEYRERGTGIRIITESAYTSILANAKPLPNSATRSPRTPWKLIFWGFAILLVAAWLFS